MRRHVILGGVFSFDGIQYAMAGFYGVIQGRSRARWITSNSSTVTVDPILEAFQIDRSFCGHI